MRLFHNKIITSTNFFDVVFKQKYLINTIEKTCYNIDTNLIENYDTFFKTNSIKRKMKKDCITIHHNYFIINSSLYDDFFVIYILEQSINHLKNFSSILPHDPYNYITNHLQCNYSFPIYIIYLEFYTKPNENIEVYNQFIYNTFIKCFDSDLINIKHDNYNEYILTINSKSVVLLQSKIKKSIQLFRRNNSYIFIPNFYISKFHHTSIYEEVINRLKSDIEIKDNIHINFVN